ncbi:MAG: NADH-quinone oxidoreductase subunit G [Pseudomonadota bacterium]|nr:NADH-quinone oxidoreductase subunit G [Pseudomonadota bacterium]
MLNIEIDGKATQVEPGRTIMDAARKLNVAIPHFCYHSKLSIAANCRMCLVQVEKAPKPLPACATPVTEGMKVQTHSDFAVTAQKGVMEFLLINHPLDCPICDQGGECQLQDLAVGYGAGASRFAEDKRVVSNKDLGPLISTDMTRCIHCTRCVRFGEEIAGVMELGMGGRGEHSEIMAFMGRTVDSEVSGNAIDLCPVGALTSKPFRYSARSWELRRTRSVSPHDGLGTNLVLQSKDNEVLRALPATNEDINECWASDKDRFGYEGLVAADRARQPQIRRNGQWQTVGWQEALQFAAQGLRNALADGGPDAIAALASPHQSIEELFALQALVRALGSGNVDHRLRQTDFRLDGVAQGAPWLGMPIRELSTLNAALVVGSTLRQDHPLIAVRLRQAVRKGARLHLVNVADDDLAMRRGASLFDRPAALPERLAEVLVALAQLRGVTPAAVFGLADVTAGADAQAIAASLARGPQAAVLLGNLAQHHPDYARLHLLAQEIARLARARFGVLGEAADSVGAWLAGAVPFQGPFAAAARHGANAGELLSRAHKATLLLGCEPDLDAADGAAARAALAQSGCVIALTAFEGRVRDYAHVILPIAPFSETAGSFVSTEGRLQSFTPAVKPLAEARPAWKVLRVLGNLLELPGFDWEDIAAVRAALSPRLAEQAREAVFNIIEADEADALFGKRNATPAAAGAFERLGEFPIYRADPLVRRAPSLQARSENRAVHASVHPAVLASLGVAEGTSVRVNATAGSITLPLRADAGLPAGVVRIPAACDETVAAGALSGTVQLERLA